MQAQIQPAVTENAINLISSMPKSATWDDIMYEIYVKQNEIFITISTKYYKCIFC